MLLCPLRRCQTRRIVKPVSDGPYNSNASHDTTDQQLTVRQFLPEISQTNKYDNLLKTLKCFCF